MKFSPHNRSSPCHEPVHAFTLVEMMTVMGIFSLVMIAMVSTLLFGLRTFSLGDSKLSASAGSLKLLDQIRDQIRSAQLLQIGNCSSGPASFQAIANSTIARGNALEIFPTTNSVPYMIYYLDAANSLTNYLSHYDFKQYTYGLSTNYSGPTSTVVTNTTTWTLASYITNQNIFDVEDYQGNSLTNNLQVNRVYGMRLQFSQWQFSTANGKVFYNNYELQTRVTRRVINND
jgi:type II secretory pathway pseudopilin PulG